jgi:hypothetical protein
MKDPSGKTMGVSELAGGYTEALAKKLLDGALKHLEESRRCATVNFPVDDAEVEGEAEGPREESFMDAGDVVEDDWSSNELPESVRADLYNRTPRETRRSIRKAHCGLGHPSQATFLRMLRLGGATPAAMDYAKAWVCPICAASAVPGKPLEAGVRTRPFGFNKTVCLDLKYLKDGAGKNHVALSAVDAGTSWHAACVLKNRTPVNVVRKLLALWFAPYGAPEMLVLDQGGEFEGAFIGMREEYGIDTRVVGAHAAWQHGFAERHGGILGTIFSKMVTQFGVENRDSVKTVLNVCVCVCRPRTRR